MSLTNRPERIRQSIGNDPAAIQSGKTFNVQRTKKESRNRQMLNSDANGGCPGWSGEMANRIRSFDWSQTELGPIAKWPCSLNTAVKNLLASTLPLVMLWGERGYMVYNDAYAVFAGGRHPVLLGKPVEDGWPEVAEFNRNVMKTCLAGGTLVYRDKELVLFRDGKPEEVWMDLFYSPVVDDAGRAAGVIAVVVETTERVLGERGRRAAEATAKEANDRLQLALNSGAVLGTWMWNVGADLVCGDERFAKTFQIPPSDAAAGVPLSLVLDAIDPDDRADVLCRIQTALTGLPFTAEFRVARTVGDFVWVHASGRCHLDSEGKPNRFPGVLIDISERRQAEESLRRLTDTLEQRVADAVEAAASAEAQLRQAQKMEAIGNLTGGVAHDFNNVLQVVSGNLQLLTAELAGAHSATRRIDAAMDAVKRGAKLANQMLAFAKRQPLKPTVLSPRRLIDGMSELLHRALGDGVTVETRFPTTHWNVLVDRNQLESALLNLAINARDAMDGHGGLTMSAENVVMAESSVIENARVRAGEYVLLEVSDTGKGMSEDTRERAFEPFFTTKQSGHGTGLGLSMVYGFVKQSGGFVFISTQFGKGTQIRMYFPRCVEAEEVDEKRIFDAASFRGVETVLVVEDEPDVRLMAVEMLTHLGYDVLEAADGDEAAKILEDTANIDLIFSDVVMPEEIKSTELARRAAQRWPPIPVLFASGYTKDFIVRDGKLEPGVTLLNKPYSQEDLAFNVRSVMDISKRTRESEGANASENGGKSKSADNPPASVLLVEDDGASREATKELLLALGHQCAAVSSAEEALAALSSTDYDLLLTDINLPQMSGLELARVVRSTRPDMAVVFVSGYGQIDLGNRLAGARILRKPFELAALSELLADVMNSRDGGTPAEQTKAASVGGHHRS
jgi:signal transduction histidine kinase/DNA-binding response OmpR family regulator